MTAAEPVDILSLPRDIEGLGYIYVLRFSTGLIKVGSTRNPYGRLSGYRKQLAPHDIHVAWCWVSAPHSDYLTTEVELIDRASAVASDSRQFEYFHGVDVDALVAGIESWRPSLMPLPLRKDPPVELDIFEDVEELIRLETARDAVLWAARTAYRRSRDRRILARETAAS